MIKLELDHSQRRVQNDRLQVFASGEDFDTIRHNNCWSDPSTNTIMLSPMWNSSSWLTLNTGIYAKLPLSDFTLNDATKWEQREDQSIKGPWLCCKDSAGTGNTLLSNATYGRNRGFYIAMFMPASSGNTHTIDFGFNGSVSPVAGWSFAIYSGTIEVWKDGVFIKSGNYSASGRPKSSKKPDATTLEVVELFILPFRKKDLLIHSPSHGGSFYVTDTSISDDEDYPEIIPDTNFWLSTVAGLVQVMVAPALFQTSGYCISDEVSFYEPPDINDVFDKYTNESWLVAPVKRDYRIFANDVYTETVTVFDITTTILDENDISFVPDSIKQICKLKCTLTSNNNKYTPFFYGSMASYTFVFNFTDGSEIFDASSYITGECSLSVGERGGDCHFDLVLKDIDDLELLVPKISIIENRPCKISIDDVEIMNGFGNPDHNKYSWNVPAQRMGLGISTYWNELEKYQFVESFPLDQLSLTEALIKIAELSGIERYAITEANLPLKYHPGSSASDFNLLVQVGDTADEWFSKLIDLYASAWYFGVRPSILGAELFAQSPSDLGYEPIVTLYSNKDDSISLGGHDESEAMKFVYRTYTSDYLEFEGNDIRTTGFDPRTEKLLQAYKKDAQSQQVDMLPSDRPDNWIGAIRRVGMQKAEYYTQSLVNTANDILFGRLTTKYKISEIECDFLRGENGIPLWCGDVIHLHNHDVTGRIQTFSCDFVNDVDGDMQFYQGKYTVRSPIEI